MSDSVEELKRLLRLSIPRALSLMGSVALFNAVDIAMIAPLGSESIAAVALASAYFGILHAVCYSLLSPIEILVARLVGADDELGAGNLHRQSLVLSVALAIVVMLAMIDPLPVLRLFDTGETGNEALLNQAAAYARILSYGALPSFMFLATRLFVEGHQRPAPALVAIAIGNLVNCFGNAILIYGTAGYDGLGMVGCAWSTVAVRWSMLVVLLIFILRDHSLRTVANYTRGSWKLGASLKQLIRIGLPTCLRLSSREVYMAVLVALALRVGQDALSAFQVSVSFLMLANMAQSGIAWGVTPRLAYHIGRGSRKNYRRSQRLAYSLALSLSVTTCLVVVALADQIAATIAGSSSVDVQANNASPSRARPCRVLHGDDWQCRTHWASERSLPPDCDQPIVVPGVAASRGRPVLGVRRWRRWHLDGPRRCRLFFALRCCSSGSRRSYPHPKRALPASSSLAKALRAPGGELVQRRMDELPVTKHLGPVHVNDATQRDHVRMDAIPVASSTEHGCAVHPLVLSDDSR